MPPRTTRELFLGEATNAGDGTQHLFVNLGPAHPAMHGIIRILAELDGELVVKADVEIGYLHRAFEKDCEAGPYNNAIPYTDRLNYVSPLINNFGYCSAVEKLLGIEITERCKYIRVIMSEISRICDHLTCVGASAMELGAFTVFLYMIKAREFLWELVEDVTGARLTISYGRVGGVKADLPAGFDLKVKKAFGEMRQVLEEVHALVTGNRIFMDRMVGVGALSTDETIAWGITGPLLRAAGVPFDLRKVQPYWAYDRMQFEIAARQERRQLRPLPGPHGGDGAGDAHRRAGARRAARRRLPGGLRGPRHRSRALRGPRQAGQDRGPPARADHSCRRTCRARAANAQARVNRRRQARGAAPEGDGVRLDRGLDEPLHARDGGLRHPSARGGGLRRRRRRQRRARLLRGLGRHRPAVPRALPAAVPAAGGRAARA